MPYSSDSLEGRAQLVRSAWAAKSSLQVDGPWVCEVFDSYAVVEKEGKYFRVPYTVDGTAVTFAEAEEVKVEYATVTEACEALAPKGKKWEVRLIREGVNKKNPAWIYTRKAIESLLPFIAGAPLRAIEQLPGIYAHLGKATVIGTLVNPTAQEGIDGLYEARAEAEIAEESREWLIDKLHDRQVKGVSIFAPVERVKMRDGIVWVKKFLGLESLDLATEPSAGGAFLRATESVAGEDVMKLEDILALLKKAKREDLITKLGATPTLAHAEEAMEAALAGNGTVPARSAQEAGQSLTAQEAQDLRETIAETKRENSAAYLSRTLAESKLPEPVKKNIRAKFSGVAFAQEALDAEMTGAKEMLDALGQSGHVVGAGETRIEPGREGIDKLQAGMDKMFDVKTADSVKDIPPFRGLLHAHKVITGGDFTGRFSTRGYAPTDLHPAYAQEAIVSADFPALLARTLNRRVVQDYNEFDYEEGRIISLRGSTSDFKLQEAINVGYYADPPIVDPEADDYLEAAKPTEESVTYKPQIRGELIKMTEITMRNDDTGTLQKRIRGRGRAYRRGHARFVWNFYFSNATYQGDSTAWFTSGGGSHGNLKSQAIAAAEIADAVTKLMAFTEQDSGEKIGLDKSMRRRLFLVIPDELWDDAKKINEAQYLDANLTPNPVYQLFGADNERIVTNPLQTDANDWGVFIDASDREIVEMKYLDGRMEPEIWVADMPAVGEMLVRDTIVFKDRFVYGGQLVDFRNAVKSIVA